jgi:hypothetical protein
MAMNPGKGPKAGKGGKGGKGAKGGLAASLKALGIKNVTPELIRAAQDLTGTSGVIESLKKPSGAEEYYGNAVGRLKSDADIAAESAGAFDRTRKIAQDMAISVPEVVSGFTSALGGLTGDLGAFSGGDSRALGGLTSAGESVAGAVTSAGRSAQGVSASVADLIAANADLYSAQSRTNRDSKREELLLAKRNAEDTRKNALITARSGAKTGLLSNLSTLLGLVPSGGGSGGGGYGSGGGSGGAGNIVQDVPWTEAMQNTKDQGTRMEGMIGPMGASGTNSSNSPAATGTGSQSARTDNNTRAGNTPYARSEWAKQEAERIKKRKAKSSGFYGLDPTIPAKYRPTSSSNAEDQVGGFSGVRGILG